MAIKCGGRWEKEYLQCLAFNHVRNQEADESCDQCGERSTNWDENRLTGTMSFSWQLYISCRHFDSRRTKLTPQFIHVVANWPTRGVHAIRMMWSGGYTCVGSGTWWSSSRVVSRCPLHREGAGAARLAVGYVVATVAIEVRAVIHMQIASKLYSSASMLQSSKRMGWSSVQACSVMADLSVKP